MSTESTTNATKVAQDGGNNNYMVETFTEIMEPSLAMHKIIRAIYL
jgi:hypothetical protein